jgi:hypothetical protein
VGGSRSDKDFGSKLILSPNNFSNSYDKAAATVSREQVDKLHKKHNKEDVLVIEKMQNGKLVNSKTLASFA